MQKSTFSIGDKALNFNVVPGTCPPDGVDISTMYKEAGVITYDPGFVSTASCKSKITFIDGENGILRYRGYDIEDLSNNIDFISSSYLLLNGELPNIDERNKFYQEICNNMELPSEVIKLIHSFRKDSHPMPILISVFASLAAYYNDNKIDQGNLAIAKMPTSIAYIYNHLYVGDGNIHKIDNTKGFSENFFQAMFGKIDPIFSNALDKILLLHADHEQNASTSTARMTASAGTSILASVASAISTLWGPLHGGANEQVILMLEEIKKDGNVQKFINRAKDKNDSFKLMGFGHRVYKNYDPRAKILRNICKEVLQRTNSNDEKVLLDIAMKLENVALTDEFFITRKLYPNVDFYSGVMLKAMGIPIKIFTLIFALARIVGWVAQIKEMQLDKEQKIARPRQIYIGNDLRKVKSK